MEVRDIMIYICLQINEKLRVNKQDRSTYKYLFVTNRDSTLLHDKSQPH